MNEMNANAVETKEPENATASTPPKIIAVDFDGCLAAVSYTHLSLTMRGSATPTITALWSLLRTLSRVRTKNYI